MHCVELGVANSFPPEDHTVLSEAISPSVDLSLSSINMHSNTDLVSSFIPQLSPC